MHSKLVADDRMIGRWIEPEEMVEALWVIANIHASTGTDLSIDGGCGLKAAMTGV